MKKLACLALSLATLGSISHAAVYTVGGPTVNPANGHSYYLLSEGSWTEAESLAQTLGGHLATVNNAAENAWIFGNVMTADHAWIGLTYSPGTAAWSWVDGDPSSYVNWAPGEPNFLEQPHYYTLICGTSAIYPEYVSRWNNAPNPDGYFAVAEVVPEPSTFSLCALVGVGWLVARSRRQLIADRK